MKKRDNNKGFSLVELIVVVLIMAIIAVVLAPQVTKWVQNSRESSDLQTMDSLTEFAQIALTDADAYAEAQGGDATTPAIKITVQKSGCKVEGKTAINAFATKLAEVAGVEYEKKSDTEYILKGVSAKADATDITIDIVDGVVTPSSNIENDDLEVNATNTHVVTPGGSDPENTPAPEDPENTPAPVAKSISLDFTDVFLGKDNGKIKLTATYTGCEASDIKWTSSDSNKVKCNQSEGVTCEIEGLRGTTDEKVTVTATIDGTEYKASCTVTITSSSTLSINAEQCTVEKGKTFVLKASGSDTIHFNVITGSDKISTTQNGNDLTISGVKEGNATIEVTMDNSIRKMTCEVTVTDPNKVTISVSVSKNEIEIGDTGTITITVTPESAKDQIVWTVEPSDKIQIDAANKTYTAVAEAPKVKLIVQTTDKSVKAEAEIKVVKPKEKTINHYLNETLIYSEKVKADNSGTYHATQFANLEATNTTFTVTSASYDVNWTVKAGWSTKFGDGGTNSHGSTTNSYTATIQTPSLKYAVFDKLADLKKIKYYGEDINFDGKSDTERAKESGVAYIRSKKDGVVTLTKCNSSKNGDEWSWTQEATPEYTIYIEK